MTSTDAARKIKARPASGAGQTHLTIRQSLGKFPQEGPDLQIAAHNFLGEKLQIGGPALLILVCPNLTLFGNRLRRQAVSPREREKEAPWQILEFLC